MQPESFFGSQSLLSAEHVQRCKASSDVTQRTARISGDDADVNNLLIKYPEDTVGEFKFKLAGKSSSLVGAKLLLRSCNISMAVFVAGCQSSQMKIIFGRAARKADLIFRCSVVMPFDVHKRFCATKGVRSARQSKFDQLLKRNREIFPTCRRHASSQASVGVIPYKLSDIGEGITGLAQLSSLAYY